MTVLQKQVQELLDELVESRAENGVQVAVYHRGEQVVDAVAGVADPATGRPVTSGTLFYSASTGKGVTSTLAHVLAERGLFTYDTRICEVWPEFAAHGKDGVTLRHALTHTAGVPAVPMDTTVEKICDWDAMCQALADTPPWWPPGEKTGYHAASFGFVVGEFIRRATGKPISQVLAEEVAGPLGVADELYFAVPEPELHRVAVLQDDPIGKAVFAALPREWPMFRTAPIEVFPSADYGNRREILTSDIPAGGTFSARAIARMYAALLGDIPDVPLVSPSRLIELSTLATTGTDEITGTPATYALGYSVGLPGESAPHDHPTMFGAVGMGGSAAYADRATGVTVAVTKNRFNPTQMRTVQHVTALVTAHLQG